MSEIEYEYSHAAVLVSNLERSAEFYERAMGWQKEFGGDYDESLGRANGYGGRGRISMGKLGSVRLQLVEMQVPLERKRLQQHFGIFLFSVSVPKLAPVRARLAAADIAVTRELDVGRVHLLILTDPDGQEVGIIGPQAEGQRG